MGNLTAVSIDFSTSHLVFPTIIAVVLGILGIAILVRDRRHILAAGSTWSGVLSAMDKTRFFGTLLLTIVYFTAMVPVGDAFPNTGLGFLLCSIPYVFLTGALFSHRRTVRGLIPVIVTALFAPTLVWWLFTEIFFLTLP